ncbi:MAG: hypothetical protein AAB353_01830 [Candidatus Hydrogenedentota bacterium]
MESVSAAFNARGNVDVERLDGYSPEIRWASFRSAELEAEYRRSAWRGDRTATHLGMLLLLVPTLFSASADYTLLGPTAPFYALATRAL